MKTFWFVLSVFFCLIVFCSLNQTYSQIMYFCEGVDDDGYPINESTSFTIPEDGGYLYVLIRLPNKVNCNTVNLMVYDDDEQYLNTITVDTKRSWTWFWKKVAFYTEGEFIIDAWDCDSKWLATGTVEIEVD